MADHLYHQLMDAVVASISADAGVIADGGNVFRNRVEAFDDSELPAYVVKLGPDSTDDEVNSPTKSIWDLILYVDLHLRSVAASLDQEAATMRGNVHRALSADHTQGLGFVLQTIPLGAEEPDFDDEGQRKTSFYRTIWQFRIRARVGDMSEFT